LLDISTWNKTIAIFKQYYSTKIDSKERFTTFLIYCSLNYIQKARNSKQISPSLRGVIVLAIETEKLNLMESINFLMEY